MGKSTTGEKVFNFFNTLIMVLVFVACLYPFLYVLALSLSDSNEVLKGTITFWPKGVNIESYKQIIQHPNFFISYKNTLVYTVVGTAMSLTMTILCAYPLSKVWLKGRNTILKMIVFTMYFTGGLIPNFLLVSNLKLTDTMWAVVLPPLISQFNLIILLNFLKDIPESLEEAAMIDGLNPFQILIKIILPLSVPAIATVGLYVAVFYWNDWFYAMIYLNKNKYYPIMLFLRNLLSGANIANSGSVNSSQDTGVVYVTLRSAAIILTALPIIMVYPLLQKYFVKGLTVGSVKE